MIEVETLSGETIYTVNGLSLGAANKTAKYGLKKKDLTGYIERGQFSQLAQFYTLVSDGLMLSAHCFQGLRRNLHCDNQDDGDESKFVLVRKPSRDYSWAGGRGGDVIQHIAPTKCVFVTLISRNDRHRPTFPDIDGWIDRWSWVEEDEGGLIEAPTRWIDRYERKIWSRSV